MTARDQPGGSVTLFPPRWGYDVHFRVSPRGRRLKLTRFYVDGLTVAQARAACLTAIRDEYPRACDVRFNDRIISEAP